MSEDLFSKAFSGFINLGAKTSITTINNDYYKYSLSDDDVFKLIINSIKPYCLSSNEISILEPTKATKKALHQRMRFSPDDKLEVQRKYGLFGEILLNTCLSHFFNTKIAISHGYLIRAVDHAEAKGFDTFHFIDNNGKLSFWIGEGKWHETFRSGIEDALSNLNKALSTKYLKDNIITIFSDESQIEKNFAKTKMFEVYELINYKNNINLIQTLKDHKINLIYPIFIIGNKSKTIDQEKFGDTLVKLVDEILLEKGIKFTNEVNASIFFTFLSVDSTKLIKDKTISWIMENY